MSFVLQYLLSFEFQLGLNEQVRVSSAHLNFIQTHLGHCKQRMSRKNFTSPPIKRLQHTLYRSTYIMVVTYLQPYTLSEIQV